MSDLGIHSNKATDPLQSTHRVGPESGAVASQKQTGSAGTVQQSRAALRATIEQWDAEIPAAVLKEPNLTRAELGWRTMLTQQAFDSQQRDNWVENVVTHEAATPSISAMQTLWTLLSALATDGDAEKPFVLLDVGGLQAAQTGPEGPILPFVSISSIPSDLAVPVKKRILKDRMVGAVQQAGQPKVGDGVYVLPQRVGQGSNQDPSAKVGHKRAVYWHGERRSDTQSDGRSVHRLRMTLQIDDHQVEITFLACAPSVSVHIATDNAGISGRLQQSGQLKDVLSSLGWQLERWSVGPWVEGGQSGQTPSRPSGDAVP